MSDHQTPPEPSKTGGCSLGCAGLFVLAAIAWPMIYLFGRSAPEPKFLWVPLLIGGPAFVFAHALAFVAKASRYPEAMRKGSLALRIVWWGIALLVATVIAIFVLDWMR
jgi:hypothetical protein